MRANILPDEQFKKDIQVVKQKAAQGFISALAKFHYGRREQQKIKLQLRDKTKARRIGSLNEKGLSNKSRNKSSTQDIAKLSTLAAQQSQNKNVKCTAHKINCNLRIHFIIPCKTLLFIRTLYSLLLLFLVNTNTNKM